MPVKVRTGVAQPDSADIASEQKILPQGIVSVAVVRGGINMSDPETKQLQ